MHSSEAEVARILADIAGTNPATGTTRYYAHDHLGSTRNLYSAARQTIGTYWYTPYGDLHNQAGVALESLGGAFTGKPWDPDAQLYYFPYRYYSPKNARWLTRDPLGMVDGPNVYTDVRGNPVSLIDPMGLYVYELLPDGSLGRRIRTSRCNPCKRERTSHGVGPSDCQECCERLAARWRNIFWNPTKMKLMLDCCETECARSGKKGKDGILYWNMCKAAFSRMR